MRITFKIIAALIASLILVANSRAIGEAVGYVVTYRSEIKSVLLLLIVTLISASIIVATVDQFVTYVRHQRISEIGPLKLTVRPGFWLMLILANWFAMLLPGSEDTLLFRLFQMEPDSIYDMLPALARSFDCYLNFLQNSGFKVRASEVVRLGITGRLLWEAFMLAGMTKVSWQSRSRSPLTYYGFLLATALCLYVLAKVF